MKKKVAVIGVTGAVGQEFVLSLKDHPWFVGVQFHPEFRSRPFTPHPLFSSFIKAAEKNKVGN